MTPTWDTVTVRCLGAAQPDLAQRLVVVGRGLDEPVLGVGVDGDVVDAVGRSATGNDWPARYWV